jgi:hypothetical protein
MGSMQEQFKNKAEQLKQGKKKAGQPRDEASRRPSGERDRVMQDTERTQREAQDRFDQDYDV